MKEKKSFKKKDKSTTLKDIFYAIKILNKYGKGLIFVNIISIICYWFFTGFIEDILFLRSVLSVLESGAGFKEFVKVCAIFLGLTLLGKLLHNLFNCFTRVKIKHFYKNLNEKIFEKAISVDMDCFYNPEFFDKYKRATEIITDNHFEIFSHYLSCIVGGTITGAFLVGYIITVDPKMLFILFIGLIVVTVEGVKSKLNVKKDKEMTLHKRSKAYVKRTIYLKEYSKDMRTSEVFGVLHNRFSEAVKNNREIIKKYGIKIALLETITGLFGMALPVAASYAYATYR